MGVLFLSYSVYFINTFSITDFNYSQTCLIHTHYLWEVIYTAFLSVTGICFIFCTYFILKNCFLTYSGLPAYRIFSGRSHSIYNSTFCEITFFLMYDIIVKAISIAVRHLCYPLNLQDISVK